jgi:hypothetical protein
MFVRATYLGHERNAMTNTLIEAFSQKPAAIRHQLIPKSTFPPQNTQTHMEQLKAPNKRRSQRNSLLNIMFNLLTISCLSLRHATRQEASESEVFQSSPAPRHQTHIRPTRDSVIH